MHVEIMQQQIHEQTTGAFLAEKAGNMSRWLKTQGCIVDLQSISSVEAVMMAQELHKYASAIKEREFDVLLANKDIPANILMTISFVRNNAHLHEKFWRYLELFSDTVA